MPNGEIIVDELELDDDELLDLGMIPNPRPVSDYDVTGPE